MLLSLAAARADGRKPASKRQSFSRAEMERAMAAQAEVEDHDIAEMMEGQAALRRKIGRPSLGDELIEEALGDDEDQSKT
ncbi:MAG: hypothetical protein M3383_03505 [Actinomycetota bacterium]|nr:hypothetical protein [Actinomycetota bacterium]